MKDDSEQKLIEMMSQGDLGAFESLIAFYERPIFSHLSRILGDSDEASDATQQTFIKLYLQRARIDPAGHFKNWLYRVATNVAYDKLRKKKRLLEISLEEDDGSETNLPELAYSTKERDMLLHDTEDALAKIPVHSRSILLLYYREGFSYEELSEMFELPLNTVKTHLRRAKEALRAYMKNYG